MNKKRKTLGDAILMTKGGFADLLNQASQLRGENIAWRSCNVCGDPHLKADLTDDPEVGCICDGCASAKKELSDEQEEIETTMRGEGKSK